VTLRAGERTTIELAHGSRGDVVVEPACPGTYTLWKDNGGVPLRMVQGRAAHVFVDEGVYGLTYQYRDPNLAAPFNPPRVRLGEIRVVAGQTTTFRHEGKPGALDIRVDVKRIPDAAARRWSVGIGRGVPTPLQAGESGLVARLERLEPGAYDVEILADGERRAGTHAVVGFDSTTRVNVTVPR
jgi:hypothetical protein